MGNATRLFELRGSQRLLSVFLFVFSVTPAVAQVHIRATVPILPLQQKRVTAVGNNTHTLRVDFNWSTQDSGRLCIQNVYLYDNCSFDTCVYSGPGSITVEVHNLKANLYEIMPGLYWNYSSQASFNYYVYLDDSLVGSSSGTATVGARHYFWYFSGVAFYTTPYASKFRFSIGTSQFRSGDSTGMSLAEVYDSSSTAWSPHMDPVALTIVSGSQFASFHRTDPQTGMDTRTGSSVNTVGDDIGEYSIVADGVAPDSCGDWVTIEAESAGITGADSVQVLPALNHFSVYPEPDTVEDSAWSTVYIQAKDIYDQDVPYDGDIQISASPEEYGELDYFLPSIAARDKGSAKKQAASGMLKEIDAMKMDAASAGHKLPAVINGGIEIPYWYARDGLVFYTADGIAPDTNTAINFTVTAVDKPNVTGTGKLIIIGTQPKLVILQPTANSQDEQITHEPKMPTVACQAQLQNYNDGQVTYNWMFESADTFLQKTPEGVPLAPRISGLKFSGQTTATGSNVSQWTVPFNGLFTGGKTILIVNATTSEGKAYADTLHANPILGKNPSPSEIRNGLTIPEQVVVYMESFPKWYQFNEVTRDSYNKDGDPVYGPPHGYGLMQIDNPPASEVELWNWEGNLSAGIKLFAQKEALAAGHPARVRDRGGAYRNATDFTQEQLLTEAFQLYNGQYYWVWVPRDPRGGGGSWQQNSHLRRDYGGQAMVIYSDVTNGNPPSGW